MRFYYSVILAFVLSTPIALAQEPNDDETQLEEIVVTATRVPTPLKDTLPSTQIITAEEIERIKPQDLGDLLSRKSGIGFRDSGGRGTSGGIFVRGTSTSEVLILIDGVRTASATTGATAIGRIPLDTIERIEIIKGPMSGVYGADAMGGVIQIFTKQYKGEGSFGAMRTTVGSNRLRIYTVRGGSGNEVFKVSASLSKESTDGIDRTAFKGGGNEDRDGFKRSSGNISLLANLQENLRLGLNHINSSATVDYDNTSTSNRDSVGDNWHQRTKLNTTSIRMEYDHSDQFNLLGSLGSTKDFGRFSSPGGFSAQSHFNTRKTDFSIQGNLNLSAKNQVSIGLDYHKDKVESSTEYDKSERSNKGLYALWQRQDGRYSTVANVRYDRNSAYGSSSNYSLQQSFDLSDQYQIVASYGTAFIAPTFNQLYWPGFGDPDLKPKESKSIELSLRAKFANFSWQVNTYQTKINNLIITSDNRAVNVDLAKIKGVEVDMSTEWDNYQFNASLDYLDAKDAESGEFLEDRARVSGSLELGKRIDNLYFGVDAFFERSRYDRGRFLPDYSLWGISFEYQIQDSLKLSGHIDNLFDKEYVINLASDDNPYQNEGRTIEMSLEYKF